MTETERPKKRLFGVISYGMSIMLLVLLVGSAGYNWLRADALIDNVTGWAARMQVVAISQMHADRALALAERESYRCDDLEAAAENLIRKLHHLQVEHMQVIMEVEVYKSLNGQYEAYIEQLVEFIAANDLPVPAPEVLKECQP